MNNFTVTTYPNNLIKIKNSKIRIKVNTNKDINTVLAESNLSNNTICVLNLEVLEEAISKNLITRFKQSVLEIEQSDNNALWKKIIKNHMNIINNKIEIEVNISKIDYTLMKLIVSSGYPLRIIVDNCDIENLEKLISIYEYYLFEPSVTTHVEPFRTIINEINRNKRNPNHTLWDTNFERIDNYYYINKNGDISISERLLKQGIKFGNINDISKNEFEKCIKETEHFKNLESYWNDLFRTKSKCSYCKWYNICEGLIHSFSISSFSNCEPWIEFYEEISKEANRISKMKEQLN